MVKCYYFSYAMHKARYNHSFIQRCLYGCMVLGIICLCYLVYLYILMAIGETGPKFDDSNSDGYLLRLAWNPSLCKVKGHLGINCSFPISTKWIINGFWSQPVPSKICHNADQFDYSKLEELLDDLIHCWPNPFPVPPNSADYWRDEWSNYGRCAPRGFTVKAYFSKAVELYRKFPVGTWIADSPVLCDSDDCWTMEAVKQALERHIKPQNYVLSCEKLTGEEIYVLTEIVLCISAADKINNLRACPEAVNSTCPESFLFAKS